LVAAPGDIVDHQGDRTFFQQVLPVMGFLGGVAFAGLVFILSVPERFQVPVGFLSASEYFGFLTTVLAISSVLCVFSSLGLASLGAGEKNLTKWSQKFSLNCALVGICSFLLALPLLLFPFTFYGAVVISALEIVLLGFAYHVRTL